MAQHRHQLLSHMAAAENVNLAGDVDLLRENISDPFGVAGQGQRLGNLHAPVAQIRRVEPHLPVFAHTGQQPQSIALPELRFCLLTERDGMFISGGEIVEKHIAGSAADHA